MEDPSKVCTRSICAPPLLTFARSTEKEVFRDVVAAILRLPAENVVLVLEKVIQVERR